MEDLLKPRYCECGTKVKESLIERMFFYADGKFSWTTFGALNGYIMLWMLFIDYFIYGRAEEVVLSWSVAIIGLMIGIRPAQKGLEALTKGLGNATKKTKYSDDNNDRVIIREDKVPASKEKSTKDIIRPTDPRNIKGRWIVTLKGEFITVEEWQKIYGVSGNNVGKYFTTNENKWNYPNWVVSEGLIRLLDRTREKYGKPMSVASLYRPGDNGSAHGNGIGKDVAVNRLDTGEVDNQGKPIRVIDTNDMNIKVGHIRESAKELQYNIRLTWTYYLNRDLACIHVDLGPMYFGIGKPFESLNMNSKTKAKFRLIGENIW